MPDCVMMVWTDAVTNKNRFYEIRLNPDQSVVARWGRVGVEGRTTPKGNGGQHLFDKLIREQQGKGYRIVDLAQSQEPSKTELLTMAQRDLASGAADPAMTKLLDTLVSCNAHQLLQASGGQIRIADDGSVRTPVGLVTQDSIRQARLLLNQLETLRVRQDTGSRYTESLNRYLEYVPQRVPAKRGWGPTFFDGFTSISRQA